MNSSTPPRWSRRDPDTRRAEIVAAARRLFRRQPFGRVSVTAVAEEAGVSRALVTHYFGGKRELFLAVLRDLGELTAAVPRTDLGLPIEQTVAHNIGVWLDFMDANQEIIFAISSFASFDRDSDVARIIDEMRGGIVDRMLLNHLGTTDAPPAARVVLRSFTGLAQVAISDWLVARRATRPQVHELLTRSLLLLMREVLPHVAAADQDR